MTLFCMCYVCKLLGLVGGIMNLRFLLLYRLQWVKFRFHQHYPVYMHRMIQHNFVMCGDYVVNEKKQSVH